MLHGVLTVYRISPGSGQSRARASLSGRCGGQGHARDVPGMPRVHACLLLRRVRGRHQGRLALFTMYVWEHHRRKSTPEMGPFAKLVGPFRAKCAWFPRFKKWVDTYTCIPKSCFFIIFMKHLLQVCSLCRLRGGALKPTEDGQ